MEILFFLAVAAIIVFALVDLRRRRKAPEEGSTSEGPLVRKEWLIAMAIVFVTLVVVLYILLGGEGERELQSLAR